MLIFALFPSLLSCKMIDQFCCLDHRCALPCDEEVPCVFGLCYFCTCCVNWNFLLNCCGTIDQIVRASQAKKGGVHDVGGGGSIHGHGNHGSHMTTHSAHGAQGQHNNTFNDSSHGQQYTYQQVQANLGGSPYNHAGSAHGCAQGSPYTVQVSVHGSVQGSAGQALRYEQHDPYGQGSSASPAQDDHQYKIVPHSAPPEAQMVVAYEV